MAIGTQINWHLYDHEGAVQELKSNQKVGLSTAEANSRLSRFGANELVERGGRSRLQILWEQLTSTMVVILIVAAILAIILGDSKNATAILAIVILYAILGFIQEYRAEKAIAALKRLSVPMVRVLRDGFIQEISARELVPGDILQLEAGNVVPADARLLDAINLRIQESVLTGESESVDKLTTALSGADLPLGDRRNLAFMGTIVSQGRGKALVVATGMQTELGKIASLLQQTQAESTPLQRRLDHLGKILAVGGVVIAALIFVLGLYRGNDLRYMLLTAVSVAVAIVPEGLPAVVTITLALGSQRMLKRNALIRKLPAVETLGSVTVICSDKTGTLTENRMTVVVMDVAEHELDLTQAMKRNSILASAEQVPPEHVSIVLLAIGGALCNDARLVQDTDDRYHTVGDPTEGALVACAAHMGYQKSNLDAACPRILELPFDSARKRMTTVHSHQGLPAEICQKLNRQDTPYIAFSKGSVDGLLALSTHVWVNGSIEVMADNWRGRIEATNERLARKGMRVLGVACRLLNQLPADPDSGLEENLTFIGLYGIQDPPRAEVKDAVRLTKTAGIRTVMITGDHPLTASEIARQLGINDNGRVLTGTELDRLTFAELKVAVEDVLVFARVSPEHKLKIVQALQENGHIVSMTGDGVNDAPALRRADIGVAMGVAGTDVAREASDLVLLDDNFATIVAAVQEGRTIYDNIRKFVRFSVAGNVGKVLVMLLAPFLGKPIPLLPLQLLWLNLLTDGLLGLGLGVEPAEKGSMKRPPYSPQEGVFSRGAGLLTMLLGLFIGILALGIGAWYYFGAKPTWQTMVFTSLAFAQIGQALAARSSHDSLFTIGLRSNLLMLAMVLSVLVLQLLVVYVPALQKFFVTLPLSILDLALALGVGVMVFFAMELGKRLRRR